MIASYRRKFKIILLTVIPVLFYSNTVKQAKPTDLSKIETIIMNHRNNRIDNEMRKYKALTKINLSEMEISLSKQSLKINK